MSAGEQPSDNDVTLASYEQAADRYTAVTSHRPRPAELEFFTTMAARIGEGGHLLELGSGPGRDAVVLESLGLVVDRTDAAQSFLAQLSADGFTARRLNAIDDELGGPYDGVFANAVFLHFSRAELVGVLAKIRGALRAGGVLAFSVKEGDNEAWSDGKLGHPRHFTFWREQNLRQMLESGGWHVESLDRIHGVEPWLYAMASPATPSIPA
ncbi:MAG: class I SAM-dependent methyltransferase [Pseudolysinimonas sp.]